MGVGAMVGGNVGAVVGAVVGAMLGKGVIAGKVGCPAPQPDTIKLIANIRIAIVFCFIFIPLPQYYGYARQSFR
jgi:hypothetical protein